MCKRNLQLSVITSFCLLLIALASPAAVNAFSKPDVPRWARGAFTARNPQTGGTITLNIERNGDVTVNFDGAVTYGSYDDERDIITINGVRSRVQRTNNGISTTRIDNGERIDYYRGNPPPGGGGNNNVPNWAIGTFYGRNPQSGGTITLTINADGQVSVNFEGTPAYGTFNNERLTINGETSRVLRLDNGIRTATPGKREVIDYYRNSGGGDNNNNNVPSWASGSFTARNPQDNSLITLTIQNNGNVVVDIGGNISYGTFNNEQITINGVTSRVTKTSRGIRTTRLDNGERINYRRR